MNELALRYLGQDEGTITLTVIAALAIGGSVGTALHKDNSTLSRVPYLVNLALLYFTVKLATVAYIFMPSAQEYGFVWLIVALPLVATAVSGFFLSRFSIARALDISGRKRLAILGFLPLFNLWLVFKAGSTSNRQNQPDTIPLMSGGKGILVAFGIMIASTYTSLQTNRHLDQLIAESETNQLVSELIDLVAQSQDELPIQIDPITKLTKIESVELELHRTYEISDIEFTMTSDFEHAVREFLCSEESNTLLLDAGIKLVEIYTVASNTVGVVSAQNNQCKE